MRLKIDPKTGTPTVTLPFLYPYMMAQRFAQSHIVWIKAHLKQPPRHTYFTDGASLYLLGQSLIIYHVPTGHAATQIEGATLRVSGRQEHLHRRVCDFCKDSVKSYITRRAKELARLHNVTVTAITVRDTVSRWGSCAKNGHLSFCWRLGLAPTFVLDYVIAHEVAHLKQMNHSRAFWAEVNAMTPYTKDAKKWLQTYGPTLHSYR